MPTYEERLARAKLSLDGLSLGDSLGGFLEGLGSERATQNHIVANRQPPNVEWHYTDDTNMALSIYSILRQYQRIDSDELAQNFAKHYDRSRGYGAGVRRMMGRINNGDNWRDFNTTLFDGGSFGNGGAMRVAPVGAYFADNMNAVIENATLSAEITHAHPEGIAGAVTIAVATAIACNLVGQEKPSRSEFITLVLPHIPDSIVKTNVTTARDIDMMDISEVVKVIGNGGGVRAQDTVPFVLYCAGEWLNDFEEAIWQTMSGGGDVDTTCAMVGGIVACYVGQDGLPDSWLAHREELPQWAFDE